MKNSTFLRFWPLIGYLNGLMLGIIIFIFHPGLFEAQIKSNAILLYLSIFVLFLFISLFCISLIGANRYGDIIKKIDDIENNPM